MQNVTFYEHFEIFAANPPMHIIASCSFHALIKAVYFRSFSYVHSFSLSLDRLM